MLTGLKVSSLLRKCVFCIPECVFYTFCLAESGKPKKMKFLKCKNETYQRVDEKKEVIRLVMFTPKAMFITISKMDHFL